MQDNALIHKELFSVICYQVALDDRYTVAFDVARFADSNRRRQGCVRLTKTAKISFKTFRGALLPHSNDGRRRRRGQQPLVLLVDAMPEAVRLDAGRPHRVGGHGPAASVGRRRRSMACPRRPGRLEWRPPATNRRRRRAISAADHEACEQIGADRATAGELLGDGSANRAVSRSTSACSCGVARWIQQTSCRRLSQTRTCSVASHYVRIIH